MRSERVVQLTHTIASVPVVDVQRRMTRAGEKWDVFVERTEPLDNGVIETWSMWQASFCQRAKALDRPICVSYRQSRWCREMVDVRFASVAPLAAQET